MLVYVIQSGAMLENQYATLDKEIAKEIIIDEILCNCYDEDLDEKEVEEFAQDLVDGNTDNHGCDEFNDINIWCDILKLQERKIVETEK